MKKAQHAVEGMIVLGVIFLIFFFLFFLYQTKSRDVNLSGKQIAFRDDCQKLSTAITSINMLGRNSVMIINIKNGAKLIPDSQVIEVGSVTCTVPTKKISPDGTNFNPFDIVFGKTKIENRNGIMVVTHAT